MLLPLSSEVNALSSLGWKAMCRGPAFSLPPAALPASVSLPVSASKRNWKTALAATAGTNTQRLSRSVMIECAVLGTATVCTAGVSILPSSASRCTTALPPLYDADSSQRPVRSVFT
jgi:hypothetical protein